MKKKALFSGLLPLMTAVMVCSCDDTFNPAGSEGQQGNILLNVRLDKDVAAPKTTSRAQATADAISVSDLALRLSQTEGSFVKTWSSIDDLEASNNVPVGEYLFEAYYGDENSEGFEKPRYYGSQEITVLENRYTDIDLTATLANAMVTVDYSDAVKDYFKSVEGEVATSKGNAIAYAVGEVRPVYVAPGKISVNVNVETQSGATAKLDAVEFTAEPRHHYKVSFEVNGGETGKTQLAVTFSSDLVDEEVEFDISDEVLLAPAPEITTTGFESGTVFNFVEGLANTNKLNATILAQAGLSSVVMTTSSASLLAQGWPAEVDFNSADDATLTKLGELGFKYNGLTGTLSQMAFIDFTDIASHINYIEGGDNISEIDIQAKDKAGKLSEPVALKIEIEKLALEIVDKGSLLQDETRLEIILSYNGIGLEENAEFKIANNRGTLTKVTPISITPVSRAAQNYKVVLPVPGEGNITYCISCGNLKIENIEVKRGVGIALNENDVFATHAAISLVGDDANPSTAKVHISTDGINFAETPATVSGNMMIFAGLAPAATYYVKAETEPDTFTKTVSFTTEAATQLPNAGMEEWYKEKAPHSQTTGFGMDAYRWYAKASAGAENFWATRNALTTAASSGPTPYYVSYSGTQSTTGVSGYAAEISSLGYGEGNTYTGPTKGTIKHKAAGMLFIGEHSASRETSETFDFGKPFTSRPAGFKFKYKFAPYNNESFKAYIVVENRDNGTVTELSRAELVSGTAVSSFTEATVNLSYKPSTMKATHMYIVFISSTAETPAVTGITGSKGALQGYADARRVGSVLTVDDITLIY